MSLKNFIRQLIRKNSTKDIQQENERLQIELDVLEKLEKELQLSQSEKRKLNESI